MTLEDVTNALNQAQPHEISESASVGPAGPKGGMKGGAGERGVSVLEVLGEGVQIARDGKRVAVKVYLGDAWRVVDADDDKTLGRLLRAASLERGLVLPGERQVTSAVHEIQAKGVTARAIKIRHRVADIDGLAAIALDPARGQRTLFVDPKQGVSTAEGADGVWWSAPDAHALPEPDMNPHDGMTLAQELETAFAPFLPSCDPLDRLLILCWASYSLVEQASYPVLQLVGGPGSGKSSAARVIHELVDPHAATLAIPFADAKDIPAAANGAHLLSSDNIEALKRDENATRAAFATGAAMQARLMHSNAGLFVLSGVVRPQSWTAIERQGRPDLLDRSVIVEFDRLVGRQGARSEGELKAARLAAAPRHFGLLLELVQAGLKRRAGAPQDVLSGVRPADLAAWVWAIEVELGLDGELLNRLQELRSRAVSVEGSTPLIEGIVGRVRFSGEPLVGNFREIEAEARNHLGASPKARDWPNQSCQKFASYVKTSIPIFEAAGIGVWNGRSSGRERKAVWVFWDQNETPWTVPDGWKVTKHYCGDLGQS